MHGPKGESYRPCEETREREPTVWFISLALRVEEPKKLTRGQKLRPPGKQIFGVTERAGFEGR